MLNIGALNLALSLAGGTTATPLPSANSVSTPRDIDNLRIPQQAEQNRFTGIKKESFESFQYPLDLRKFYMRIDFKKYQRPNPTDVADVLISHSVCLPIPTNLSDRFDLDYSDYDGGIAQQLVGSATNMESQGFTLSPLFGQFNKLSGAGKAFVNIAAQNLRVALNPLKSVVFNSPRFKQYQFTWTFAPNTEQESIALRRVIKKIKASVLPTYVKPVAQDSKTDYNIFNYPYMAQIHLFPWAEEAMKNPKDNEADMFQTKHGFIDNITINYSPENNISFFDSEKNSPTFVEFSFSFIEIELHSAEDYGQEKEKRDEEEIKTDLEGKLTDAGGPPPDPSL